MTKKWLETRRSYLDKLKSQVRFMSGAEDMAIERYALANKSLYEKIWNTSSEEDFFKIIKSRKIVLCGDFHSSPSVKRFYIKTIKSFIEKNKKKPVLALECFEEAQSYNLNLWLKGSLSESLFLERCNWKQTWGFSWESYKSLILELHNLGVEVVCVNHAEPDFSKRDKKIAQSLDQVARLNPDSLIFCIIGQHHLGPTNLKADLKAIHKSLDPVCLHLDPEELYFEIGDITLLDEIHVLNVEDHFAFFNSPPWVHWQSHLLFLDEYLEETDDEHDFHSELNKTRDYEVVVWDYIKLMCKDLGVSESLIKRVSVASIDEHQIKGQFTDKLYKIMQPMLDSETSFYWPEQSEAIMVINSLNHAGSVAGRSLHAQMMKVTHLPWGEVGEFKTWVWLEAMGYFLSKLINPKRSPIATHNLSAFLNARLGERSSKKIMTMLVKSRVEEIKGHSPDLGPMTWNEVIYASRLKGSLVGESLFELYLRGELESETIKTYLFLSVTDKKYFEPLYDFVVSRLNIEELS